MAWQKTARIAAILVLGASLVGYAPRAAAQGHPANPKTISRSFPLSKAKRQAIIDLFVGSKAVVRVGSSSAGMYIEGTPAEALLFEDLTKLLDRYKDRDAGDSEEFLEQLRPTWTTTKVYNLSEDRAAFLFRLLAFDDVPVLVSRDGGNVTVEASESDQRIIGGLVKILLGSRLNVPVDMTSAATANESVTSDDADKARKREGRNQPKSSKRARQSRRPSPSAPEIHDAAHYKAELEHLKECHKLIDHIHKLRGTRRSLQRRSLEIQQQLEKLGEDLEKLDNDLDEAEVRLNIHLQGEYHKKSESSR